MGWQIYTVKQLIQFSAAVTIKGFINDVLGQMRCKLFDKVIHEPTQESTTTKPDFGHTGPNPEVRYKPFWR